MHPISDALIKCIRPMHWLATLVENCRETAPAPHGAAPAAETGWVVKWCLTDEEDRGATVAEDGSTEVLWFLAPHCHPVTLSRCHQPSSNALAAVLPGQMRGRQGVSIYRRYECTLGSKPRSTMYWCCTSLYSAMMSCPSTLFASHAMYAQ